MSDNIVLEVRNITKKFPGIRALSNFNMTLERGEVHGVVGENGAGKSTLMNIISGNMAPNSGEILIDGQPVRFENSRQAQSAGISIVHQELINCPDVTVAENIFMGLIDKERFFVNYKKMYERADVLLSKFNICINASQKMKNLKVSDQQIVEIVKAISMNCKIVIFDEPTAALTEQETQELFQIINEMKSRGISILYISHRMEEIFKNCDRVTVLKDGYFVDTLVVSETTPDTIINKMVGRDLKDFYPPKSYCIGETIFEVKNFSFGKIFSNISFSLKKGEILGLSGLVGSGRSEVARAVCGIDPKASGEVFLYGKKLDILNYQDAVRNGLVYLTEDRKKEGLLLNMAIMQNISVLDIDLVSGRMFVLPGRERALAESMAQEINIKSTSVKQKVGTLSGGNQQKVLIAKSLAIEPKVIIMDEPTRGVDVGAKAEIYNKIRELANKGIGIIIISSELPEIIGMCDHVCVMHEGKINGILSGEEIEEARIMHRASGF